MQRSTPAASSRACRSTLPLRGPHHAGRTATLGGQTGGWIEAEFDLRPDAWYVAAERTGEVPYCILLEAALQPCGWLAAYMGSALKSANALHFRNLEERPPSTAGCPATRVSCGSGPA